MMSVVLFVVIAGATLVGALVLSQPRRPRPVSTRSLRRINEHIDEQERTR